MIEFARGIFRGFFVFTLWIWLFICTIGGGVIGYKLSWGSGGYAFLGVILGLFFWLLYYILGGGLLATFLNMDENLEIIANNISKGGNISQVSQGSISDSGNRSFVGNKRQKKCTNCKREIDEDYSSCPHCGNKTFE